MPGIKYPWKALKYQLNPPRPQRQGRYYQLDKANCHINREPCLEPSSLHFLRRLHYQLTQPRQRRRRGYNQRELIAFLDAQERNVERIEPADDDIIAEFDPLNYPQEPDFEQFVQIYDRIDRGVQQGRRTIRFRL